MIYRYHPRLSVLRFFFWHRAGPVILESILPIHILNQARLFGKADLTGIFTKKNSSHLVSLIKVEGLFSPYIVTHFDIVNSESLV